MGQFRDLTDQRFGRLIVQDRTPTLKGNTQWNCLCDCGQKVVVSLSNLSSGRQVSCGCFMVETSRRIGIESVRHGHARGDKSLTYRTWISMIQRTTDPNCTAWRNYGGRGILVCDRWRYGENGIPAFECFLADMGERTLGKSVNRIDNDGHYEPGNCEWATSHQQTLNKRTSKLTDEDAAAIRRESEKGVSPSSLAERFNIHPAYVRQIIRNERRAA